MRKLLSLLLISFTILIVSCAPKYDKITTTGDKAYLQFTGNNLQEVYVLVGDSYNITPKEKTAFTIAPGKYRITAYRKNAKIFERDYLIGGNMTEEINLP